ncbi:MAG: nucleotidyl transferase AbiEii/AbiGii toxin family protein [Kiritimatiellaeota bacterium]|nr:nucleotidyl transferase AbiEii/AbiGii toxin family protein [Kiritimatiellota bacterium]
MMDRIAQAAPRERANLFQEASGFRPGITSFIIEKDFWVCWALKHIFRSVELPLHLIFKGGTTLSKVFHVIERFSEDVDLSFDRRELGFDTDHDPANAKSGQRQRALLDELKAECETIIRKLVMPALLKDFALVLGEPRQGPSGWDIAIDPDDSQTINFRYPPALISLGLNVPAYIRQSVRLEMGARSDAWPTNTYPITPYAAEIFPNMFQSTFCEVNTLEAIRTFWEKATLLHAEFHRTNPTARSERMSRHYYDLYCLSKTAIGARALMETDLLKRVIEHKRVFFRSAWAHYETAVPGSFHLIPAAGRIKLLRNDYTEMKAMIFGASPEWDIIMEGLKYLEDRINRMNA